MTRRFTFPTANRGSRMSRTDELEALAAKAREGGAPKYHQANAAAGKLFCRERIALLCDDGGKDFVEDGLLANATAGDLPADGVVTGIGRVHGRPVAIMANDSTVKAGSWGARTVEKIIRIQETAGRLRIPLVYLVDSAGARIPDQLDMFPRRRAAPISRRSATWCSWSTRTPPCTWARRAWPRW